MSRTRGNVSENNLAKGLITEATGLTSPQGSFTSGDNIIVNLNGSVERRLGFDQEPGGSYEPEVRNNDAMTEYVWDNVAGSGDLSFVVIQIGERLSFYQVSADGVLSTHLKPFGINISAFELAPSKGLNCQFSSGGGRLFVFHPSCDPFYVEYNPTLDSISSTRITLKIRDFEGVSDGLEIDERPSTLTDSHEYNLYNQGWYQSVRGSGAGNPLFANAIAAYSSSQSDYPSNNYIWWLGKTAENLFNPTLLIETKAIGNTPAPKGHFIMNPFLTNRSNAHIDIGTVHETSAGNTRPKTGAFFAGRVWYAGVDAAQYTNKVYFSQIVERDEQIPWCYQINDPTSEVQFDLLPSDGGVITIQEAGSIIKLFPMQDSLLVMATNGIWSITGSQGIGFTANDFSINKVSGTGLLNPLSVVDVSGVPFWWNNNSIWLAEPSGSGALSIKSLTDQTIQSFYDDILVPSKKYAKGGYNPLTKIIQWVYRSSAAGNVNQRYNYDRILCFNLNLQCFYTYSVPNNSGTSNPSIHGVLAIQNKVLTTSQDKRLFFYPFSYQVVSPNFQFSFAREFKVLYLDWVNIPNANDEDYASFFITGYKVLGEGNKDFQNNYVTTYMGVDEGSRMFVRGLWDFTETDTKRFSRPQQVYRHSQDYTTVGTRLKIRGHGKALQLYYYSETGKPFTFLGYAIEVSGNAAP